MQICGIEMILRNKELESRTLTNSQLVFEVQIDTSEATSRCKIGGLDNRKCLKCQPGLQSPSDQKKKMEYAKYMLKNILNLRIGIIFDLAIIYTLN